MDYEAKKRFLINSGVFVAVLIIGGVAFTALKFVFAYLMPFVIGLILAFVMQRPARNLAPKLKMKRGTCAAILVMITYLVVFSLVGLLISGIVSSAGGMVEPTAKYVVSFTKYVNNQYSVLMDKMQQMPVSLLDTVDVALEDTLNRTTREVTAFVTNFATSVARNMPTFLISSIVTVVASWYIAKDFDMLLRFCRNLVSEKIYTNAVRIKNIFTKSILKFLIGYLILMGITFIELMIGFYILGVPYAPLMALGVAFIDVLPVLGTGTVLIPWAIFDLIMGNVWQGVGLIILYAVILVVRNVIEPKIIGKQMGVNPLLTLLTMFIGLRLFGLVGMLLVPICFIVLFTYYKEEMEKDKKTAEQVEQPAKE